MRHSRILFFATGIREEVALMLTTEVAQHLWAENKYLVMSRSQQDYNALRQLFSDNEWSDLKSSEFIKILASNRQKKPTRKTLVTTYQHVWGYFKKLATAEERNCYKKLLEQVTPNDDDLESFLYKLAVKYEVRYLINSRLFKQYDNGLSL